MSETKSLPAPDASPENASIEPPAEAPAAPPARGATAALVLALIALGLAIGLAVAVYFSWNQLQHLRSSQQGVDSLVDSRLQPLRESLQGVDKAVQTLDKAVQARSSDIDHRLQQLDQRSDTLERRMEVLTALMGRSEQGWNLAEVEYLLRIANQRLQLQRDTATAEAALRSADQRLRDLADPRYLTVREQIARDLEAVEAVPAVDVDGIAARLKAAVEEIDALPVAGTDYQPPAKGGGESAPGQKKATELKELPEVVWAAVRELVTIREHDRPLAPMLPPEREYFLRENMRLQLVAARLALLRDDAAQYRSSLATARQWLDAWFDHEDGRVKELSTRLQALEAIDIHPALPDVSDSLRLLRQQMKLAAQQPVLPRVPAALKEATDGQEDSADAEPAP